MSKTVLRSAKMFTQKNQTAQGEGGGERLGKTDLLKFEAGQGRLGEGKALTSSLRWSHFQELCEPSFWKWFSLYIQTWLAAVTLLGLPLFKETAAYVSVFVALTLYLVPEALKL